MMVKIGVIFMPFLNFTCHFRATADFTSSTYSTYGFRPFFMTLSKKIIITKKKSGFLFRLFVFFVFLIDNYSFLYKVIASDDY